MSLIDKAARILRAGDDFSPTNQKLREAVWELVEFLHEKTKDSPPPYMSTGIKFERLNDSQIRATFYVGGGYDKSFVTNSDECTIENLVLFCRHMAGTYGENLVNWLERETAARRDCVEGIERLFRDLRVAQKAPQQPSVVRMLARVNQPELNSFDFKLVLPDAEAHPFPWWGAPKRIIEAMGLKYFDEVKITIEKAEKGTMFNK